jgi:hypothetical protein
MASSGGHMKKIVLAALLLFVCLSPLLSCSLLSEHKTTNIQLISDGSEGAIIAWQNSGGIYMQRINSAGQALWQPDGVKVSSVPNTLDIYAPPKVQLALISDDMGGAIITWADTSGIEDKKDGQIYFDPVPVYSQRVNGSGTPLWGDGIETGTTAQIGTFPQVIPDGTGGMIFVWNDFQPFYRALHDDYLRVQKINPDGTPVWGNEGWLVTGSSPYRYLTSQDIDAGVQGNSTRSRPTYDGRQLIASDGAGGLFVLWEEEQSDFVRKNAYMQHVSADGILLFSEAFLIGSGDEYTLLSAITDDNGGVFITGGSTVTEFVHAQLASKDGQILPAKNTTTLAWKASLTKSDGMGGIIISRNKANPLIGQPEERRYELFTQRLDEDGQSLWPQEPIFITGLNQQIRVDFIAGDNGGAIVVWRLFENNSVDKGVIYLQMLDSQGNTLLPAKGIEAFPGLNMKYQGTPIVVSDGNGGAIIVSALGGNSKYGDMVYTQRIDAMGNLQWENGIRIDK